MSYSTKLNKNVNPIEENALLTSKFEALTTKTVITKAVQTFGCEDWDSAQKYRSRPETRTHLSEAPSQSSPNSARFREIDPSQKSQPFHSDSSRRLFHYPYGNSIGLNACQHGKLVFEIDDLLLKQRVGCVLNFKFLKQKKHL